MTGNLWSYAGRDRDSLLSVFTVSILSGCHRCRVMSDYMRAVESSGWLKHLRAVVECGLFIATSVAQGTDDSSPFVGVWYSVLY